LYFLFDVLNVQALLVMARAVLKFYQSTKKKKITYNFEFVGYDLDDVVDEDGAHDGEDLVADDSFLVGGLHDQVLLRVTRVALFKVGQHLHPLLTGVQLVVERSQLAPEVVENGQVLLDPLLLVLLHDEFLLVQEHEVRVRELLVVFLFQHELFRLIESHQHRHWAVQYVHQKRRQVVNQRVRPFKWF